jgi:hypothetical protein
MKTEMVGCDTSSPRRYYNVSQILTLEEALEAYPGSEVIERDFVNKDVPWRWVWVWVCASAR